MLSVVGHDLSGVQDNDDGREGSVDDSDSEKGMVSTGVTAGWVRAQGPKEPSLHARPLKSALKKSNTSAPTSTNSPSPLPTPTQDHQHGGVAWQEPPPPPSTRPLRFGISLGGGGGNASSDRLVAATVAHPTME